jgi:hypothetical protein
MALDRPPAEPRPRGSTVLGSVVRLVGVLVLVVVVIVVLLRVVLAALHTMLPSIIVIALLIWIFRMIVAGRR